MNMLRFFFILALILPCQIFADMEKEDFWSEIPRSEIEQDKQWSDILKDIKEGVVSIETSATTIDIYQPFKTPREVTLYGSGFFINKEGYILTNAHVVSRANKVHIFTQRAGREKFEVELIGRFASGDIALLKLKEVEKFIEFNEEITFLPLSDSDDVMEAENIMALGYPLHKPNITITEGIVSGFTRNSGNKYSYIQTNSALNKGNSGGPSIDKNGAVIGLNTSVSSKAQNIGYIIPINIVKTIIKSLLKNGEAFFPGLGFSWSWNYKDTAKYLKSPEKRGIIVVEIFPGSTAEKIGLKRLDVLTKIDTVELDFYGEGEYVKKRRETLTSIINRFPVGNVIPIQFYRDGIEQNLDIKLEKRYEFAIRSLHDMEEPDYEIWGGLVMQQLNINLLKSFKSRHLNKFIDPKDRLNPKVIITHIFKNSQGQKNRIMKRSDIIEKINGREIVTLKDVREILDNFVEEKEFIVIETNRGTIAAIDFNKAKEDEPELRKIHKYTINRPNKKKTINE